MFSFQQQQQQNHKVQKETGKFGILKKSLKTVPKNDLIAEILDKDLKERKEDVGGGKQEKKVRTKWKYQ